MLFELNVFLESDVLPCPFCWYHQLVNDAKMANLNVLCPKPLLFILQLLPLFFASVYCLIFPSATYNEHYALVSSQLTSNDVFPWIGSILHPPRIGCWFGPICQRKNYLQCGQFDRQSAGQSKLVWRHGFWSAHVCNKYTIILLHLWKYGEIQHYILLLSVTALMSHVYMPCPELSCV